MLKDLHFKNDIDLMWQEKEEKKSLELKLYVDVNLGARRMYKKE